MSGLLSALAAPLAAVGEWVGLVEPNFSAIGDQRVLVEVQEAPQCKFLGPSTCVHIPLLRDVHTG